MKKAVLQFPSIFPEFEASKLEAKIQSGDPVHTSGQWGRGADCGVFVASDRLKATIRLREALGKCRWKEIVNLSLGLIICIAFRPVSTHFHQRSCPAQSPVSWPRISTAEPEHHDTSKTNSKPYILHCSKIHQRPAKLFLLPIIIHRLKSASSITSRSP